MTRPRVVCETLKLQNSDVVTGVGELLSDLVFVQWWVNRIEKSDSKFAKNLVKTPLAYVKDEIRNKLELRADMWESFQIEMTSRVENVNFRFLNKTVALKRSSKMTGRQSRLTPYLLLRSGQRCSLTSSGRD